MIGKKRFLNIIYVFTIVVVLIVLLFLVSTLFVYLITTRKEKRKIDGKTYRYKSLYINGEGNPSYGIVRLKRKLEHDEFISSKSSDDDIGYSLISNFGTEEYKCTGSCYCEDDTNNDRRTPSIIVLRKGLQYLVAAFSTIGALALAKEHFYEECRNMEISDEPCPLNSIKSEVNNCKGVLIPIDDIPFTPELEPQSEPPAEDGKIHPNEVTEEDLLNEFGKRTRTEEEIERDMSSGDDDQHDDENTMYFLCDGYCHLVKFWDQRLEESVDFYFDMEPYLNLDFDESTQNPEIYNEEEIDEKLDRHDWRTFKLEEKQEECKHLVKFAEIKIKKYKYGRLSVRAARKRAMRLFTKEHLKPFCGEVGGHVTEEEFIKYEKIGLKPNLGKVKKSGKNWCAHNVNTVRCFRGRKR